MSPRLSVLVPAHDEERVVPRCLRAALAGIDREDVELLVVANGCRDRTAEAARSAGAEVLELAEASKVAALRAGDARLRTLPRVYLDADVVLGPGALRALADALPDGEPRVAAPRVVFRTEGRPLLVRAFYAAYTRLPYVTEGMVGSGVYALSAAGRARFEEFPDLTADDLFVQRLFTPEETVVLPDVHFVVETPRTLSALLAVRTRTARGNAELSARGPDAPASTSGSTASALGRLALRRPGPALVYLAVTLAARRRARRTTTVWDRDTSTR